MGGWEDIKRLLKAYKLSVIRRIISKEIMYSMVTLVDDTEFYHCNLMQELSPKRKKGNGCVYSLIEQNPSQCKCISNHHSVQFKYFAILFVN